MARWAGLTHGTRVWADGEAAIAFIRGGLHPDMARELYTMPSDVLLGKSVKSLLWVSVNQTLTLYPGGIGSDLFSAGPTLHYGVGRLRA